MVAIIFAVVPTVQAGIDPSSVNLDMSPGESQSISKTIGVNESPPKLDLYILEDETGSFWNDIATLQALAPQIFDDVRVLVPDSRFGVGGFRDFPFGPWGDSGDWAYRRVQDMTADKATFVNGVNALTAGGGNDSPESQYEALYQAATGAGKTYSGYTIPSGENASFRDDAFKVIILTTDASFHTPPGYPGPTRDETVIALNSANITVIALKAPGAGSEMDDIAAATGGVVKEISDGSAEIADAIVEAIGEVLVDVTLEASCDTGLTVTFNPSSWIDVDPPTILPFDETVSVDSGFTGILLTCTVTAKMNDEVEIGTQTVTVNVNQPPVADAGDDQTVEQTYYQGADVTLDGSGSSDPNGDPLTYLWTWAGGTATGVNPTVSLPLGTTTVTLVVNDGTVDSALDTVVITVQDTTLPEMVLSDEQIVLWPPNHKYHTIGITECCVISVTDICDADVGIDDVVITSVSSDEPENVQGEGDGNTLEDIVIVDSQTVELRAERQGDGNGRVYTINFEVTDDSGNTEIGSCTVWVPHDQGSGSTAVDDGPAAGYTVS